MTDICDECIYFLVLRPTFCQEYFDKSPKVGCILHVLRLMSGLPTSGCSDDNFCVSVSLVSLSLFNGFFQESFDKSGKENWMLLAMHTSYLSRAQRALFRVQISVRCKFFQIERKQARKPRSYASPKLCPLTHLPTHSLTGVKCRATSVAKNRGIPWCS